MSPDLSDDEDPGNLGPVNKNSTAALTQQSCQGWNTCLIILYLLNCLIKNEIGSSFNYYFEYQRINGRLKTELLPYWHIFILSFNIINLFQLLLDGSESADLMNFYVASSYLLYSNRGDYAWWQFRRGWARPSSAVGIYLSLSGLCIAYSPAIFLEGRIKV